MYVVVCIYCINFLLQILVNYNRIDYSEYQFIFYLFSKIHILTSVSISDTDEKEDGNIRCNVLSEYYKSQGSGTLKEDFIKIKKENYNLVENKEGIYRDFALLQENYENMQDKLEKCVEFNDELIESRNSLQVQRF